MFIRYMFRGIRYTKHCRLREELEARGMCDYILGFRLRIYTGPQTLNPKNKP